MKTKFGPSGLLLGVAVSVPLDVSQAPWQPVVFGSKAATEYSYVQASERSDLAKDALKVRSQSSSGAQIYYFSKPQRVLEVHAQGVVKKGGPVAETVDDALLRWGVIYAGDRRLNWIERRFVSDWIVDLDAIAKKIGSGFGHLELAVYKGFDCPDSTELFQRSDYVFEECAGQPIDDGSFKMQHRLQNSAEALGLWLSADADDSDSEFEIHLTHLGYMQAASPKAQVD